jgi:methionyl-tRNA formyltransferase
VSGFRTVFLGTPETAVPALGALQEVSDVVLVITRPDRPRGRSGTPQPPPIKEAAAAAGLPIGQPQNRAELSALLNSVTPFDLGLVTAYGMILPETLLQLPARGMVNLHFSLLPRWRGASPVQAALRAGDETTGVTLMQMEAGLDTGPVLAAIPETIHPNDHAGALGIRLAQAAAEVIHRYLPSLFEGKLVPVAQDGEAATHAPALTAAGRRLDLTQGFEYAARQVRALAPRPGATVAIGGDEVRLLEAAPVARPRPVGRLEMESGEVLLGAGDGSLRLITVQPSGRREMSAQAFVRGRPGSISSPEE